MKKTTSTILAAAVSGLFLGSTMGCSSTPAAESKGSATMEMEKHACAGMNSCQNKGGCKADGSCKGVNACKGKGGCATVEHHSCAGKNACKGQGGCHGKAGANACAGKGGCAVPVKH